MHGDTSMNKRNLAVLILLLVVAGIVSMVVNQTRQHSSDAAEEMASSSKPVQRGEEAVEKDITEATNITRPPLLPAKTETLQEFAERYRQSQIRPIDFYGKVVDEKGQPVPGATATINWANADGEGNKVWIASDENGLFSLLGQRGKGIQVRLHHPSFYNTTNNPISFEYADVSSRFFHRPNSDVPIIFSLKRKGQAEPLIVFKKSSRIAKDGTPVFLDLVRGSVFLSPQGQLKLECLTMDKERDAEKRYDWTFSITVPNGGVFESTNEFDFVAPSEAYSPSNVFVMRKEMGADWSSKLEKNYFLKLGNGTFGRMRLTMISGGDHFFKIESFVNPSGSRNLEFDPAVQPKQSPVE